MEANNPILGRVTRSFDITYLGNNNCYRSRHRGFNSNHIENGNAPR